LAGLCHSRNCFCGRPSGAPCGRLSPPSEGFTVTYFLTVADIERSARYYEKVFGGRILSLGDSKGASGHIQIANMWLIVNVGGGPIIEVGQTT
jgi:hypothetical protein